jgi:hypothetical protein
VIGYWFFVAGANTAFAFDHLMEQRYRWFCFQAIAAVGALWVALHP